MSDLPLNSIVGYLVLSFITWSVTFAVVVFGVMLRRKILLWDDFSKEEAEKGGMNMKDTADELQRTFWKVRATYRWLGFFLFVFLVLMGAVVYLAFLEKPPLGMTQTLSGLWILSLVALSAILPAFINFGVGTYVAETMFLKANVFAYQDAREEMKEKRAKLRIMEQARQMKEKREALKNAAAQAAAPAPGAPGAPAATK
jgi:hypothetical protein